MPRSSTVHYIQPSALSIIANANGNPDDIAVAVVAGAKIKVYSPALDINTENASYQEWTLTGRNRRLADSQKPYTIYARLSKTDKTKGYIVFAPKTLLDPFPDSFWEDKYKYITPNGLADIVALESYAYWYVRLGDVSLSVDGKRTLTLDTGILGTEQYNEQWNLTPDARPLRVELGCTIDGENVGATPYVYFGKSLALAANLVEGWDGAVNPDRIDHWEIVRNSGNSTADEEWNHPDGAGSYREMPLGQVALAHVRGANDDFAESVATTFTVTAYGTADDDNGEVSGPLVALASAIITVLAETVEKYSLELSASFVSYNPSTQTANPSQGVAVKIRVTDQKGGTSFMTNRQLQAAQLSVFHAPSDGTGSATQLVFSGDDDDVAEQVIPASVFLQLQKNLNVRLVRGWQTSAEEELSVSSIAFVRDGEDGMTADNFLIENSDGERTAWVDELGNFQTRGVSSGLQQSANALERFLELFVPLAPLWNGSEPVYEAFTQFDMYDSARACTDAGGQYVYKAAHKVGAAQTAEAVNPMSDDASVADASDITMGKPHRQWHSLDMRSADGIIDISFVPDIYYDDGTLNKLGNQSNLCIMLPWLNVTNIDASDVFTLSFCRTPTHMSGSGIHYLTSDEMKQLVGRKMVLVNNTAQDIFIRNGGSSSDFVILYKGLSCAFEFVLEISVRKSMSPYGQAVDYYTPKYFWKPTDTNLISGLRNLDNTNFGVNASIK